MSSLYLYNHNSNFLNKTYQNVGFLFNLEQIFREAPQRPWHLGIKQKPHTSIRSSVRDQIHTHLELTRPMSLIASILQRETKMWHETLFTFEENPP